MATSNLHNIDDALAVMAYMAEQPAPSSDPDDLSAIMGPVLDLTPEQHEIYMDVTVGPRRHDGTADMPSKAELYRGRAEQIRAKAKALPAPKAHGGSVIVGDEDTTSMVSVDYINEKRHANKVRAMLDEAAKLDAKAEKEEKGGRVAF